MNSSGNWGQIYTVGTHMLVRMVQFVETRRRILQRSDIIIIIIKLQFYKLFGNGENKISFLAMSIMIVLPWFDSWI